MKRRDFFQASAWVTAGVLVSPSLLASEKQRRNFGLQLYSLRDSITKDPKAVLKQVAGFGYTEVEAYSYRDGQIFGLPYKEFCQYSKRIGIQVVCGHYGLDQIKGDGWTKAVDDAKKNGMKFMVVPSIPEQDRKSIDDYKRICHDLNKAGEICKARGIRFGYHNHDFEFKKLQDQIPYDVMLAELDHRYVGMEMDLFWVINAGYDPLQYFEKYPGRFEQWHVKDMSKSDRSKNADVGTGSIDFKAIFAKAKLSGMKHFYIEQETYPGEAIDSVGNSIQGLKTILL